MRRLWIAVAIIGLWLGAAACTTPVTNATDISVGVEGSCLINTDGGVECWGVLVDFGGAQIVVNYGPTAAPIPEIPSGATDIEVGFGHACAIVSGDVKCWGDGSQGQTGLGSTADVPTPTDVIGLPANDPAVQLSTHLYTTCARLQSGAAACWGQNDDGQVGDGTTTNQTTAVMVTGLDGTPGNKITDITAGDEFTCATRPNETAGCWGRDNYGQLGNGPGQTDSLVPSQVPGLSGVVAIEAGRDHVCAATANSVILCWGRNSSEQLAAGGVNVDVPTFYNSFSSPVVSFAASVGRSCAVIGNGTAECVGANGFGSLGNGTTNSNSSTPTLVVGTGGSQSVAKIDTKFNNACLLGENGSVACWGAGYAGQLGNGDTSIGNPNGGDLSSIPVQVIR